MDARVKPAQYESWILITGIRAWALKNGTDSGKVPGQTSRYGPDPVVGGCAAKFHVGLEAGWAAAPVGPTTCQYVLDLFSHRC
jgi:hypothetical protein